MYNRYVLDMWYIIIDEIDLDESHIDVHNDPILKDTCGPTGNSTPLDHHTVSIVFLR